MDTCSRSWLDCRPVSLSEVGCCVNVAVSRLKSCVVTCLELQQAAGGYFAISKSAKTRERLPEGPRAHRQEQ
ncbi:hypothetical protein LMH87_010173 [Akanthomyces muscarius]|uniref:Uncharacterized protein n=1 Tax=Akanthomyces muscarius TaxID=2231603 RepID=A0A9W8QF03_AKAMU|nr:hypothetical protein LMH87_010173 [Akanthomyces muscarius]KAJ4153698.1 hypothetical protein LMH87_010173 [Akanthomyces muscarius]